MSLSLISGSGEDGCLDSGAGGERKNVGIWDVTILLKMSVPTRAVSGANRRRPAANWHDRRCILSVSPATPTEHRGPLGVSEPVNHLCSRSNLPTLV